MLTDYRMDETVKPEDMQQVDVFNRKDIPRTSNGYDRCLQDLSEQSSAAIPGSVANQEDD